MNGLLIFIVGLASGIMISLLAFLFRNQIRKRNDLVDFKNQTPSFDQDYTTDLKNNVTMWNIFSNAMPIHVYIKNADDEFRYVYSNQTRDVFFGMKPGELIGQNDTVLLSPENARKQLDCDAEIMTKPQGIYSGLVETKDDQGNQKFFRIAQTQYTDPIGTRLLLGAALDITELEESRRLLDETRKLTEERELWLSRTLASIGDAVIVTDKQGNTVLLNPVAERMLGVQLKDAIGKPHEEIFNIVGAMDNEPRQSPVNRALRTGVIVELANHTDLVSKTGDRYHISDSAAPITDEQHNILGAVLVFRDVTEIYQRRAALRDALNDWEMASNVSGIVSFRVDYKTRKISGSQRLSEFWPVINGIAADPKDWILPEDLAEGRELMTAVLSGKLDHAFYKYRVQKDGKIHHYLVFAAVDSERSSEITGIIQDITEAYEKDQQLQNTREMWNHLVNILPLHFFAKNVNDSYRYTLCNRRFAEFLGKNVEDVIGKTDAELFGNPNDIAHFEYDDQKIARSGKSCNFTETVYGLNSRPSEFQSIKMPCTGPSGELLLLGISIDITELVTLSKSQEIIRQGLEMLVTETDLNEGITKAMKTVCEYIDVARSFIFHFDMKEENVTCVREYYREGEKELFAKIQNMPHSTKINWAEHFDKECFFNVRDLQNENNLNQLGPFYANLVRVADLRSLYCHRLIVDGQFWGFVGLAYQSEIRILDQGELDFVQSTARFIELIIRHKRTQENLQKAVIQAQTAEKAKSSFLATMSHEIRTPLNAVIGYSELLQDGTLPEEEQKDYLKNISVAGNSLLALINDILDLSKLDAEKMQLAKSTTDFTELVHEIEVIFDQKLREKHLTNHVDFGDIPLVKIDPLRVRQILFNLYGNAVKFTDQGSITVSAKFVPNENGRTGTLTFAITDTGCGISKEDSKQLFQPFVQSKAMLGTRKAGSGTGLGLVLVRRMLDLMDGTISLESTPGFGSTFSVTMRDVEFTNEKIIPVSEEQSLLPEETLTSCRILLVDDIVMNLTLLQKMLRKLGMEAVTTTNAVDAIALLKKEPFDIVLTDLWMPGMNGLEMAEAIRRSEQYPNLKIAITTADTEVGINYNSKTFDAVLTKPITIEKLKGVIKKFTAKE